MASAGHCKSILRQPKVQHSRAMLILSFMVNQLLLMSCNPEGGLPSPGNYIGHIELSTDETAAVSPDGNLIAYFHASHESPEPPDYPTGLYLIDSDGTNRRLLLEGGHWSPSWSPDSQWLVFTSGGVLQIINVAGDSIRTFQGINEDPLQWPRWSLDGERILFSAPLNAEGGVFSMTPDFNDVTQILAPIENHGMFASWSPDRSNIVYNKSIDGIVLSEIFILELATNKEIRLTYNDVNDKHSTWSADGQLISWNSNTQIYLMSIDGSNQQRLDYGRFPAIGHNSQYIVYSNATSDYKKEVLWKIDITGKNKIQLTY